MTTKDYAFLLISLVTGLLCFYAAGLSWSRSRSYGSQPERWRLAVAGGILMTGLGVMEILGGLSEALGHQGEAARRIDWFWLGGDLLLPLFYLMAVRSFRRRDALEAELAAAAEHDPLTGLPNRAGFGARARAALEACCSGGWPAAVALLDIDHFKAVNDGWGHAAGDEILCGIARAMRPALRPEDVLGRIGGEEFAMVLPGVDTAAALPIVERLRAAIQQGVPHPGAPGRSLTVSAGLALIEGRDMAALEAAMRRADAALYAAKGAGRNCALIAGPTTVAA